MPATSTLSSPDVAAPADLRDDFLKTLRCMIVSRILEEKLGSLYRAGGRIVGGVYLGRGQEAFSAAAGNNLRYGKDIYGPLIRDQAGRIAYGEPLLDAMRTYLGVVTGPMRGRDGNIHRGRPREGLMAMISHLGSLLSVVSGALFARRLRGTLGDTVGATSIGDGGTSTGAFHEGLNMAAVEKLPLIISVANNQFAYSTPTARQYACEDLVDRARGYGVDGHSVDGTDLLACVATFRTAFARARAGHGPQMVVGKLLRLGGHGEHDDASYIPDSAKHKHEARDCIEVAKQQALEFGWATETDFRTWEEEARREVDAAQAIASKEPTPDPYRETWHALSTSGLVEGQHG
ncbi:pyruvate dehydrogenase E1 component alpha subunit/2-oxoisovalerate dehydrogenase E1 component alpha subunit [Prosthecobacter fusiformis]|uniref:2-oxoisovalerate dehydrogenase subunit alpha n=1 Tax=Prosthecobacter fusiformis TaxID=48464 RepID=A0A4V6Q586_9BACT|nr:thiamine pyrophosphate-dependent dehydrogenase E1 component subunit alpha [Prosthecobacter fusiformis]TDU64280.1 pyruvate dehydrogenase E1 component alpha subunit/2-oxoisovalerate dehydrogenase E1 component alpha subunit [Prosthecobacter fusiformis]